MDVLILSPVFGATRVITMLQIIIVMNIPVVIPVLLAYAMFLSTTIDLVAATLVTMAQLIQFIMIDVVIPVIMIDVIIPAIIIVVIIHVIMLLGATLLVITQQPDVIPITADLPAIIHLRMLDVESTMLNDLRSFL